MDAEPADERLQWSAVVAVVGQLRWECGQKLLLGLRAEHQYRWHSLRSLSSKPRHRGDKRNNHTGRSWWSSTTADSLPGGRPHGELPELLGNWPLATWPARSAIVVAKRHRPDLPVAGKVATSRRRPPICVGKQRRVADRLCFSRGEQEQSGGASWVVDQYLAQVHVERWEHFSGDTSNHGHWTNKSLSATLEQLLHKREQRLLKQKHFAGFGRESDCEFRLSNLRRVKITSWKLIVLDLVAQTHH